MDEAPAIEDLVTPPDMGKFRKVPPENLQVGKFYYTKAAPRDKTPVFLVKLTSLELNPRWNGLPVEVYYNYGILDYVRRRSGWEEYLRNRTFITPSEFYLPINLVIDATQSKSQVQAVKDVLASKGLPDTQDTGPLGNILNMAGIKAPPKRTGLGRRKTGRRTTKKRTTRRR